MEHFTPEQIKAARLQMRGLLCLHGLDLESAKEWAGLWVDARVKGVPAREIIQGGEAVLDGDVKAT